MKTFPTKKKTQAAQVYFPADLYLEIKLVSNKEGKAMASWIREVVTKEVKKHRKKKMQFSDLPTFSHKDVDPYLSEKIDEVVYDNS